MCDNQDTELPKNLKFGKAAKNGDCFFDSVAQGLKQIKPEAELTIKSLREICKEYAQSQLKDKHSWLNEALSNEKEQINEYISCIEFTAIDIEQGSANTLRLRSPIWGRPDIEGRIICEKHNIELHIIEKCNLFDGKVMWAHQIVNKLGSKFLKKWYGNDGNTIHIATQGNEHFDPILRVKEVEVKIPTKKEEVQKKLILFVENFVFLYEKYISEHYERLENRTEKQGKWTSFINKVIDKGKGSEGVIKTVGIKTSVGVGINVLQSMMASLDISDNRKELKKLVNQLYFFKENKSRATEELIKAGIDIFQSFECQFVQVTANGSWERAMAKLAEDAVSKVIDYSKNNPEEGFSASFITKGVILGKSKTYKHTSTSAPHIKPGHTLQNGSFIWNTSKVFDTAGLVTVKSDGASDDYYSRRDGKSNTNEYGYRLCFSWELQDLNVKYQEDTQPQEKYQYTLKLDKKAKENLKNEILNKINKAKEVSNQYIDRLEGSLKEAIKEVKQNAIENVKEIEHCISEDFDKLLGYIDSYYEQTKAKIIEKTDEIKQQNKRLHEESYQQNNKIAKFIKEGREENKKGFNYLSQKISNLADIGKNNGQAEEPIFFNVKGPIKSFTGRKQDLRNLHSKIQSGKCTVISQMATISGLGGVGKTELAREYVNQYYQSYDSNVIWIDAENLVESFLKLSQVLGISVKDINGEEKDIESIVQEIYKSFAKRNSIFIFDNAEKGKSIKQFLPLYALSPGDNKPYILITSRIAQEEWKQYGIEEGITLDVLTDEEAINFISSTLEVDAGLDDEITELAINMLHKFPLALQQAVAHIRKEDKNLKNHGARGYTIDNYITEYKEKKKELLNSKAFQSLDNDYAQTTLTTWRVTIDKIKKEHGALALECLDIMAYLAPDNIPVAWLLENKNEKERLWNAVNVLNQYSLLRLKEGKADIHRLVQEVMRLELNEQGKEEEVIKKVFELLDQDFHYRKKRSRDCKKQLLPHMEEFLSHVNYWLERQANSTGKEKIEKDYLINLLAYMADEYDSVCGRKIRQIQLLDRALSITWRYYGYESLKASYILHKLSYVYNDLGRYSTQIDLLACILDIKIERRREYKSQKDFDLERATILEELAAAYGSLFNYQKQVESLELAQVIKAKHYGCRNIEMCETFMDVASAYASLGDASEAGKAFGKAFSIAVTHYGLDSLQVIQVLENLVLVCEILGDYKKQSEVLHIIIKSKEKLYGSNYSQTFESQLSLSISYIYLGKYCEAKQLLNKILKISEQHYRPGDPKVVKILQVALKLTSEINWVVYDPDEQKKLFIRILGIQGLYKGPNSFEVYEALIDLSLIYVSPSDFKKKKKLLEKALYVAKELYGESSLEISDILRNIALVYIDFNDYCNAESLLEQALAIQKEHYKYCAHCEDESFDLLGILKPLYKIYKALGDLRKQIYILEWIKDIEIDYHKDNPIKVAGTLQLLSDAYESLNKVAERDNLLELILDIKEYYNKHINKETYMLQKVSSDMSQLQITNTASTLDCDTQKR